MISGPVLFLLALAALPDAPSFDDEGDADFVVVVAPRDLGEPAPEPTPTTPLARLRTVVTPDPPRPDRATWVGPPMDQRGTIRQPLRRLMSVVRHLPAVPRAPPALACPSACDVHSFTLTHPTYCAEARPSCLHLGVLRGCSATCRRPTDWGRSASSGGRK